ncbi:hypothetical protein GGD67_002870 [Bradyrhizobium sp. IAR9]|uniref:hypothetical protein n=1 Tax=Bradyrhizobium sp. IAR9 TaxID=2663841 RepID=UPI0015C6E042|nr:hypothetical protein [Bradyrhizobium sp. IAR9]NYG45412.1 hypothetical protein [Bradyrhizobium sp. IAR9]
MVVDKQSPVDAYGVAFRKEGIGFRDAFDDALRSNGAMKELYAEKYGVANWEVLSRIHWASDVVPTCE